MQVGGRTGRVLVMKGVIRVSSAVWVGEKQFGGRTSWVLVMKGAVRVSIAVWVRGGGSRA